MSSLLHSSQAKVVSPPSSWLVVGAGLSGLMAAQHLAQQGHVVTVVDKGRGFGGRLATRRLGLAHCDHGAQYFTVRTPAFAAVVKDWQANGWVCPWFETLNTVNGGQVTLGPVPHTRYVGQHGMSSLPKALAAVLEAEQEVAFFKSQRAVQLQWLTTQQCWQLTVEALDAPEQATPPLRKHYAQHVLLTCPMPQTLELLATSPTPLLTGEETATLQGISYAPSLAFMWMLPPHLPAVAQEALQRLAPGFKVEGADTLAWVGYNHAKGGNPATPQALTLHATPAFSQQAFEAAATAPAEVMQQLVQALNTALGLSAAEALAPPATAEAWQLHRWRYAQVTQGLAPLHWQASQHPTLLLAGDAFGSEAPSAGKVEAAVLSGLSIG